MKTQGKALGKECMRTRQQGNGADRGGETYPARSHSMGRGLGWAKTLAQCQSWAARRRLALGFIQQGDWDWDETSERWKVGLARNDGGIGRKSLGQHRERSGTQRRRMSGLVSDLKSQGLAEHDPLQSPEYHCCSVVSKYL